MRWGKSNSCRRSGWHATEMGHGISRATLAWCDIEGKRWGFLVAHTGFEPVISSLRGRCPNQLDECATGSDYTVIGDRGQASASGAFLDG